MPRLDALDGLVSRPLNPPTHTHTPTHKHTHTHTHTHTPTTPTMRQCDKTPLHAAAARGKSYIVEPLLAAKVRPFAHIRLHTHTHTCNAHTYTDKPIIATPHLPFYIHIHTQPHTHTNTHRPLSPKMAHNNPLSPIPTHNPPPLSSPPPPTPSHTREGRY